MKSPRLIAAFCATLALLPPVSAQITERFANPLFDQPVRIRTVLVPAAKDHDKGTLTCLYYPDLMVKEAYYENNKGAGLLSVTWLEPKTPLPVCQLRRAKDERLIEHWGGFFLGAKDLYLFFEGGHGSFDGGGFVVYHAGDKVLEDAGELQSVELTQPRRDPNLRPWRKNPLQLRYRRAYLTPCSLRTDAESCWRSIQQITGLTEPTPLDCNAAYEPYEKSIISTYDSPEREERLAELRSDPSYIDYDVETTLDEEGVIRITPVGPAVACYLGP
jgi:hypothetical protein